MINSISTSVPSPTSLIKQQTFPAVPDTGCSGHYFKPGTPISNMRPDTPTTSLQVHLPDGVTIQSSHSGTINLPDLPPEATECHIFPDLSSESLLSVGQLCNSGCKVSFDNEVVDVMLRDKLLLSGLRTPHNGLWSINLPASQIASILPSSVPASQMPSDLPSSSPSQLNLMTSIPAMTVCQLVTTNVTQTIAERVAFYHASLFHPPSQPGVEQLMHKISPLGQNSHQNKPPRPDKSNAQSTHPKIPMPSSVTPAAAAACITAADLDKAFDSHPPPMEVPDVPGQCTNFMFAAIHEAKGQIFTPKNIIQPRTAAHSTLIMLII
eukprot:scaffold70121_cov55-Attheya_sp.AAC.6